MDTLELLSNYIKDRTDHLDSFPTIVYKGINTIAGEIPNRLKITVTLSELITFSSHLRKHIILYDGTLVPTNAIVFALSASGTSKDKSLNTMRKSLGTAYDKLEEARKGYAKEKAIKLATLEGNGPQDWQLFYSAPKPLQTGLGTVEGLLHHFADIAQNPLGAGSILSTEIGSELQTNGEMTNIIKTISQAYDLGNVDPKVVKSADNQTQFIKGFPINALFFGSQEALLFNNDIKAKFKLIFNTQLARRSIFSYTPETPPKLQISSIDELSAMKEAERAQVLKAQHDLNVLTSELVETTTQEPLTITSDTNKLFDVYLEYNSLISDEISNKYPIAKLSRKHKQWLALKLAGTYAILAGKEVIDETTYAYAINTVELLAPHLSEFEKELIKEPYEQLADLCQHQAEDGELVLSLHELRKLGYIVGAGSPKTKLQDLVTLVSSYDTKALYSSNETNILYKKIVKTDIVGVSYLIFESNLKGTALKDYMSRNCSTGYEFYETTFKDIALLLKEDAAYNAFRFKEGIRSKANIISGTKVAILDIDKSYLTDEEVHILLNEYNHYIVRTSDPDNQFKFRVLLELDAVVDIDDQLWKAFLEEIEDELGLTLDILPKSQIFFSFKDRNVLTQLDGIPLETKSLLDKAAIRIKNKPTATADLPIKVKKSKLSDPRTTFTYTFDAEPGERSRLMYRALAHAIDLGADETYIKKLASEINNYWVEPLDEERLQRTLVLPALRRI